MYLLFKQNAVTSLGLNMMCALKKKEGRSRSTAMILSFRSTLLSVGGDRSVVCRLYHWFKKRRLKFQAVNALKHCTKCKIWLKRMFFIARFLSITSFLRVTLVKHLEYRTFRLINLIWRTRRSNTNDIKWMQS